MRSDFSSNPIKFHEDTKCLDAFAPPFAPLCRIKLIILISGGYVSSRGDKEYVHNIGSEISP